MEPFSIAALSGAGAIALLELLKATCQLARMSRVTDLSFLWGLVAIKRDPLQGEEILHDADADAEDDYDNDIGTISSGYPGARASRPPLPTPSRA